MTDMPDVIAKTRIFASFEKAANDATHQELTDWLTNLRGQSSLRSVWDDADQSRELPYFQHDDVAHIYTHVFGSGLQAEHNRADAAWWDREVSQIAAEGAAQAVYRMLHDDDDTPLTEATKRPLSCWWICPATYTFRMIVMTSPYQVTLLMLAPPKGDHPEHYQRYQRKLQNRPGPDPTLEVPYPYDQPEPIWVVSSQRDAVTHGQRSGTQVEVSGEVGLLTRANPADVAVRRPYCENYLGGSPAV